MTRVTQRDRDGRITTRSTIHFAGRARPEGATFGEAPPHRRRLRPDPTHRPADGAGHPHAELVDAGEVAPTPSSPAWATSPAPA
jgi:hypothetical protein